jgi:hypothetical protein
MVMTEPTQLDKARYSLYTLIIFYVLSSQLVSAENKSRLIVHAVVFGIIVFGMMQIKGI